jgi:hypothetical protein
LAAKGSLGPTAFFVQTDGTMKVVTLLIRDEQQKETLIGRIREKTKAENVTAVLVLVDAERGKRGMMILSGVAPGMSASARVEYSFDKESKSVTSWKISWLEGPPRSAFLEGVFDKYPL